MSAKTVELREAQANLKDLLTLVAQGTEIVVTDGTIPVARLVPVKSCSTPRTAGLHAGAIWSSEDFDHPLPDTFWSDPV
jgi:prevent-host-death family protein